MIIILIIVLISATIPVFLMNLDVIILFQDGWIWWICERAVKCISITLYLEVNSIFVMKRPKHSLLRKLPKSAVTGGWNISRNPATASGVKMIHEDEEQQQYYQWLVCACVHDWRSVWRRSSLSVYQSCSKLPRGLQSRLCQCKFIQLTYRS